jgi:hypothetical protein
MSVLRLGRLNERNLGLFYLTLTWINQNLVGLLRFCQNFCTNARTTLLGVDQNYKQKGGDILAFSPIAPERVARTTAPPLSEESSEGWCVEYSAPQTLVCFQE